jgi:hypothetical protein
LAVLFKPFGYPACVIILIEMYQNIVNLNEFEFLVFNATFSNISAISWRPVLVVEETRVPEENQRPWTSNW